MSIEWKAQEVMERIRRAAAIGVVRGTERVLQTAVQKIQSPPKTGRIYRRRGVDHQASAPGEAPATDTGRLAQSGRTTYDDGNLTGRVTFSTEYAAGLEFGTQRVAARPFLRPSLSENVAFVQEAVREEIAAELRR